MVHSRGLLLKLVDAQSMEPLAERVDATGTAWVKGEPGAEFFVKVGRGLEQMTADPISAQILVDGKDLGYRALLRMLGSSRPLGPHKVRAEGPEPTQMAIHAFRFQRHEVAPRAPEEPAADAPPATGRVEAIFWRTQLRGRVDPWGALQAPEWTEAPRGPRAAAHKKDTAGLHAAAGTTLSTLQTSSNTGVFLEEVGRLTLCYTTDFGMAVRGLYRPEEVGAAASSSAGADDARCRPESEPAPKRAKVEEDAAGPSKDRAVAVE